MHGRTQYTWVDNGSSVLWLWLKSKGEMAVLWDIDEEKAGFHSLSSSWCGNWTKDNHTRNSNAIEFIIMNLQFHDLSCLANRCRRLRCIDVNEKVNIYMYLQINRLDDGIHFNITSLFVNQVSHQLNEKNQTKSNWIQESIGGEVKKSNRSIPCTLLLSSKLDSKVSLSSPNHTKSMNLKSQNQSEKKRCIRYLKFLSSRNHPPKKKKRTKQHRIPFPER